VLRPSVEDFYGYKVLDQRISMVHQPKMPSQKPSLRKRLNKQKKRTFGPLTGKCRKFAKLPGVNLALIIEFEKKDINNQTKKEFYSLRSKRNQPFLRNIDAIVSLVLIAFSFL
jgi:hypothetical protein